MTEFPSQSHKSQEPREIKQITQGTVRSAPPMRRFKESVFQGNAREVWGSMFWDVFVRGITDNIAESFHAGIDTLFRGQGGGPRRRSGSSGGFYSPSSGISKHNPDRALGARSAQQERFSREDRNAQRLDVIEIDSRAAAEEVLGNLNLLIDTYDLARLSDFYMMVGQSPEHTDYNWGWEDLGGAEIKHSRGSYYLDLPPLIPVKS